MAAEHLEMLQEVLGDDAIVSSFTPDHGESLLTAELSDPDKVSKVVLLLELAGVIDSDAYEHFGPSPGYHPPLAIAAIIGLHSPATSMDYIFLRDARQG